MDDTKGYQLIKNVTDDPESEKGKEIQRKFLGESGIKSFHFSVPPGEGRSPDTHTVDCAIFVVNGNLEIGFGEQFEDKVVVGKGDFLFMKKDMPHLERALGDESADLIIYYTGVFGVK